MRSRHLQKAFAGAAVLALGAILGTGGCGKLQTESGAVVRLIGLDQPDVIKDQYFIVMWKDKTPDELLERTKQQVRDLGGVVTYTYEIAPRGFAARIGPEGITALRRNPNIDYIEADRSLFPTGVQTCPPWNLDRIDQESEELNGVYAYGATGLGVDVYVLDTGIDTKHVAFAGKTIDGISLPSTPGDPIPKTNYEDCNGHGTHIAGIVAGGVVGGQSIGVAKDATLHAVNINTNCCKPETSGTETAAVIDEVIKLHKERLKLEPPIAQSAVAVMSFAASGNFPSLEEKVEHAVTQGGLVFIVSAGNEGVEACLNSPAGAQQPLTVGWVGKGDFVASKGTDLATNFGDCVDLFAPGSEIVSARSASAVDCSPDMSGSGTSGLMAMTGSSQAAAHVAGAAALVAQQNPEASPTEIINMIITQTTAGKIKFKDDDVAKVSRNLLLRTVSATGDTGTPKGVTDQDACNDGGACEGGSCVSFCAKYDDSLTPEVNERCCSGLAMCGGGLLCTEGVCESCGTKKDEACCEGETDEEKCLPAFDCNTSKQACSCGLEAEPCCHPGDECENEPNNPLTCGSDDHCVQCGDEKELCCNGKCNSTNLECSMNTCVPCGQLNRPCCGGQCTAQNLQCNGNNTCVECGLEEQLCCDATPGSLPCQPGRTCDLNSGLCKLCGAENQFCCDGSVCNGGMVCTSGVCKLCGGPTQPCCNTSPACGPGLECNNGTCNNTCGSGGQACCGITCDGDMECVNGSSCRGLCYARCRDGTLLHSVNHQPTTDACIAFANEACQKHGMSDETRVEYNNKDIGNPGACGAKNQACCEASAPACSTGSCTDFVPGPSTDAGLYVVDSGKHCL